MRSFAQACVVLLSALAVLNYARGPDLGGVDTKVTPGVTPTNGGIPGQLRAAALTPGLVLTSTEAPVGGALVIARAADGLPVAAAVSDSDGCFELTTPPNGPYFLEVVGTPISGVPFDPAQQVVVVLP